MSELSEILDKHLHNGAIETPIQIPPPAPPAPKKEWKCRYCGRSDFPRVQDLASHVRIQHRSERQQERARGFKKKRSQAGPPLHQRKPGYLTAKMMIDKHRGIIKQIERSGTSVAMREHPEWEKLLLGRGEPRQTLYDAINRMRWGNGARPEGGEARAAKTRANHKAVPKLHTGRPPGSYETRPRKRWTQAQYDLARSIMENSNYRLGAKGKTVAWEVAFREHPDWARKLDYDPEKKNVFLSFIGRVRDGSGPYHGYSAPKVPKASVPAPEPETPATVRVNGKDWTIEELEQVMAIARDAQDNLNHCPNCGFNLKMHTKAFTIAKRHSQEAA